MRCLLSICAFWCAVSSIAIAADLPLVERFLHAGEFDQGEQHLAKRLVDAPEDDQARFGLGVLQFLRGVERLGQGLHNYGVKGHGQGEMFLRMPVPEQTQPAPIGYRDFRRLLDDFRRDLDLAETTLTAIKDDQVKLPLRLAGIHFDLDHDGKATDRLLDMLQFYNRGRSFVALEQNPDFLVAFDRGDVPWLRAYCHILMACLDLVLGVDNEALFNLRAQDLFANPRQKVNDDDRRLAWATAAESTRIREPLRWARAREHFIKAAALNKEVWEFIRKETDNDSEWLPNSKQSSVLGLRVNDRMIDAWLVLWDELDSLFSGKKVMPYMLSTHVGNDKERVGVNFQRLLDDPPEKGVEFTKLDERYFTNDPEVDLGKLFQWYIAFGNSPIPMALWFN